jgi:hypothetical protein
MATATLETEFCGQRLSTHAPPMSRRDGGMDLADRLLPPQVAEISPYSADQEIMSICADSLVELRGFELMAIAVSARRDLRRLYRLENPT